MKVAILAGGTGSRLGEETNSRPKAMVEIGGRPILWHVMSIYAHHGFDEFVVALGYKGEVIRRHLLDHCPSDWRIALVDTGQDTSTGGRIKRLGPHLGGGTFLLTWCDGLADVDVGDLLAFHRTHGRLATVTAVHPPTRFGYLEVEGDLVVSFREKPPITDRWINGAFFVLEPETLDYVEGDRIQWERGPMQRLAEERQLMAYRHPSFWQCMDTVHDKEYLERLWQNGRAPWKVWE